MSDRDELYHHFLRRIENRRQLVQDAIRHGFTVTDGNGWRIDPLDVVPSAPSGNLPADAQASVEPKDRPPT